MNYINKRAHNFAQGFNFESFTGKNEIVNSVKSEIDNIDNQLDKVTFLRIVLEYNSKAHQKHLLNCTNKDNCDVIEGCESRTYYLTQELNRLGIKTNNDQFTIEEKNESDLKLDKVLSDLQTLKNGQQIIYEDLKEEIESLRELYILGKKTWYQLLIGKSVEMVVGGIISETLSKEIISTFENSFSKMIE